MNDIEKLLSKVSPQDKIRLVLAIDATKSGMLTGVKMKGSNFYKVRVGHFRIIYSIKENGRVVVDEVRRRNEKTYRDF